MAKGAALGDISQEISDWPTTPAEARAEQQRLRGRVETEDRLGAVNLIAGLDAHYAPRQALTWGAAAVIRISDLALVESALACAPLDFPYVPGLLSFRETPALLAALATLQTRPDLLMIDGQGLAHPRRFGLACHVGVLSDLPTIGVAKSRLFGKSDEPGPERGAYAPLMDGEDIIGKVLRSRARTRPLYVSTGHRVSADTAVDWVLRCAPRYRLTEPIRLADRLSRAHSL
jgi:deoxyribonuclease V